MRTTRHISPSAGRREPLAENDTSLDSHEMTTSRTKVAALTSGLIARETADGLSPKPAASSAPTASTMWTLGARR